MRWGATFASALIALLAADMAVNLADAQPVEAPALVQLKPGSFQYWATGEFSRDGKPADSPQIAVQVMKPFAIMARQVSVAEYRRCVDDKACPAVPDEVGAEDRPAVMVSWRDAQAYAAWLSRKLGGHYRLPTDEEWTYAAASRAPDEGPLDRGADDPGARIRRYEREARLQPAEPRAPPFGTFGTNENGLADIAGNVWEWTDTCFTRATLDGGSAQVVTTNCGVRVVEGRHRTYVTDFIRDARGGGCAFGAPPSNLGFRLVREERTGWLW
jgi:formylglycine-generating enzyme required for sulfatase activity